MLEGCACLSATVMRDMSWPCTSIEKACSAMPTCRSVVAARHRKINTARAGHMAYAHRTCSDSTPQIRKARITWNPCPFN